jgi:hypothetical protein
MAGGAGSGTTGEASARVERVGCDRDGLGWVRG